MRPLEKDTAINSTTKFLNATFSPIYDEAQLTNVILYNIQKAHSPLVPLQLPNYCQYPKPARFDDFNLKEGLGHVSIQPAIDALNDFKKRCIEEIKTKMQATGPESAKDQKLALGAVDLITQVYQAASCYVKVAQHANNLVDSYIQIIDTITNDITQSIDRLTQQINKLKRNILAFPTTILACFTQESIDLLGKYTGVFELLALTSDMMSQLNAAFMETHKLAHSPERFLLGLEADLAKLHMSLQDLAYALSLTNILGHNRKSANSMYMNEDDYLKDFIYSNQTIEAANFNFSITNTNYLSNYNSIDAYHIITTLNKLCISYDYATVSTYTIASQSEPGYIVVPDDGMILSVGIDSRRMHTTGLVIELNINSGATIIRAEAFGKSDNSGIEINKGIYIQRSLDHFSYSNACLLGNNEYKIIFDNSGLAEGIALGSYYTFRDPSTSDNWIGYRITGTPDNPNFAIRTLDIPLLFKVINISNNTVNVSMVDASELDYHDFIINDGNTYAYDITNVPIPFTFPILNSHDLPNYVGSDGLTLYLSDDVHYRLIKMDGSMPKNADVICGPSVVKADLVGWNKDSGSIPGFTTTGTNPENYRVLDSGGHEVYRIASIKTPILDMQKYLPLNQALAPHAGEKIYCKNWSLYCYLIGDGARSDPAHNYEPNDPEDLHNIRFSNNFPMPNNPTTQFAMGAKWGFIPDRG